MYCQGIAIQLFSISICCYAVARVLELFAILLLTCPSQEPISFVFSSQDKT